MPLYTASHSLRSRKTKKDGRTRTSSTSNPKHDPIENYKNFSSLNDAGSKQALKPQADSESPKPVLTQVVDVFQFLDSSNESSSSDSSEDEPVPAIQAQAIAKIQAPKPRASSVSHAMLAETKPSQKATRRSYGGVDSRPPPAPAPPREAKLHIAHKGPPRQKPSAPEDYDSSRPESPPVPFKRQLQVKETALHRQSLPPSPPRSPEDRFHRGAVTRRNPSASQVSSGYGLVASQLTHSADEEKATFPPLYRRFESMNHRVLLHLQDEISQMEEDLQALDEYEEMHRVAEAEQEGRELQPASRRMDAQTQGYSSLHYRRMDLMAALIQKTEQYNTALSAYSKVLQTLPRASEDDVQNYRSWMKKNNPITAAETRFLYQDTDLVSLAPRPAVSASAAATATSPIYIAIIIASGAILLPLLAFSMLAEFSGRLVVVTVTSGAAAAIAANYPTGIETLVDSKDGWRCATLYFGFMTVAAMFIP
ncbi:hypothetical protein N7495_008077 [Penicillium taxi]|uniref:uncharacterized protein n=1 Tax=Penicillium taxi TaxID=168475 RepID=UPI002545987A|nr:uncharacterized protein N7495_008077 [Penicillium taxi]KAJ5888036.1 hypothetical protein N7495_008077 [Penicillium taxi]